MELFRPRRPLAIASNGGEASAATPGNAHKHAPLQMEEPSSALFPLCSPGDLPPGAGLITLGSRGRVSRWELECEAVLNGFFFGSVGGLELRLEEL